MATSLSVLPDKFEHGDFNSWLRTFVVCATANGWSEEDKLRKLPAFLRGQAYSFYHTLAKADTDAYVHLASSLRRLLCPKISRERYYSEFDGRTLRPGEDPSLYLHELTELLFKADPGLSEDATKALLARQFMKGLHADTLLKLLQSNPTPTLAQMRDFIHRFNATHPSTTFSPSAAFAATPDNHPSDALQSSIVQLSVAVTALATQESKLQTAVEDIHQQPDHIKGRSVSQSNSQRWQDVEFQRRNQRRCFNCQQPGHFRSSYPWLLNQCRISCGLGHTAQKRPQMMPPQPSQPRPQHLQMTLVPSRPAAAQNTSLPLLSRETVSHNSLNFNGVPQ